MRRATNNEPIHYETIKKHFEFEKTNELRSHYCTFRDSYGRS